MQETLKSVFIIDFVYVDKANILSSLITENYDQGIIKQKSQNPNRV